MEMMNTRIEDRERTRGLAGRSSLVGFESGEDTPETHRPSDGHGRVVVVEDVDTHSLQRRYCHLLGVIILSVGLVALAWGLAILATFDEENPEGRPSAVAALSVGTVGFFLGVAGPRYISKSLHMRPHEYLDTGILLTVRHDRGGWTEEVRNWDQMGRFHRANHWYMGPAIIVDVGIPGDNLIVPRTMVDFDRVEFLLSENLKEASGAWELFD